MRSRWIYVLLGNGSTGKTSFQKNILRILTGVDYERLPSNTLLDIIHPHIIRKIRNISVANRSIQERITTYHSVGEYFENHFKEADICIVSSHVSGHTNDVKEIIQNGKERIYNICGVFFQNSIISSPQDNKDIAKLSWDERLYLENPIADDPETQDEQVCVAAEEFVQMLIERTRAW